MSQLPDEVLQPDRALVHELLMFTTNGGRYQWMLRPTSPLLVVGEPVSGIVYCDVAALMVDGKYMPNGRTFAAWNTATGQVTLSSRSTDPNYGAAH